jgi:predicted site-specific integrase-resolvase
MYRRMETMNQKRYLKRRIARLEKAAGLSGLPQIPPDLKTVYFFYQRGSQSREKIEMEIEKKKAELVEKYGRRVLKRLHFIVFKHVSSDREKPSLAP